LLTLVLVVLVHAVIFTGMFMSITFGSAWFYYFFVILQIIPALLLSLLPYVNMSDLERLFDEIVNMFQTILPLGTHPLLIQETVSFLAWTITIFVMIELVNWIRNNIVKK